MLKRYTQFAEWSDHVARFMPFQHDRDWYARKLAGVKGRILELACGNGRIMRPLCEAGHEVWGLDICP